jgi:hypothetical protein
VSGAPHFPQKFVASGLSNWHFGHFMVPSPIPMPG